MPGPRFLQLADVAEVLNISANQVYALVRRGDIPAVKIGGRGQWRVEATELEKYIERLYTETKQFIDTHPFGDLQEVGADAVDRAGDRTAAAAEERDR
jgi:excisionase family DNA binding protein